MYKRFAFEEDVHTSLACVPLAVRRKLDLAALKISLAGWQMLTRPERLALCHLPVDTKEDIAVYQEVLAGFAARASVRLTPLEGSPTDRSAWSAEAVAVRLKDRLGGAPFDAARLRALDEESRYALFKLADPKRDIQKLRAALRELEIDG
jgi:hypothetical protein